MNSVQFLIQIAFQLFDLYIMVVILRAWLQWARADFYNPFSQFIVKATQPIVAPLRRFIPAVGPFDLATISFAYLLIMLKLFVLTSLSGFSFSPLPVAALLGLVKTTGTLLLYVLIARAILSWISQGRNPIELVFHQLTDPITAPLRRVIPTVGIFDLSFLVLFIGIQFANSLIGDLLSSVSMGQIWFAL